MKETVFISGGTGFLGTEIVLKLIRDTDAEIYVLVRSDTDQDGTDRLRSAWYHEKDLVDAVGKRIHGVRGDVTRPDLGLDAEDRTLLQEKTTRVFHCAAEIGFQTDEDRMREINCLGTENMLDFARSMGKLRRFIHISTAYVAGQNKGDISEEDPPALTFNSLYEKSKAEAERMVRDSGLPFSICRPGMIIGDSKSGWVRNFNTIYYVLKLALLGRLRVIPTGRDTGLNIIPVDHVAEAAVKIGFSDKASGRTFHLTCPRDRQPKAGELMDYVRSWAKDKLDTDIPRPVFLPLHILEKAGRIYNRKAEGRTKGWMNNLLTLLPYFFEDRTFDRSGTDEIAGAYHVDWRDHMDLMLDFATRANFMRQSGKNVFQQARERRASRRFPINYYDVSSDGIVKVTGDEANGRIDRIADALLAWGVGHGDRIGITGINSVDYMTLDQAIGLIGAVSVPIYYTTPVDEVSDLLTKSGAKWFFVGDRRMMRNVDRLLGEAVRIVAFSEGQKYIEEDASRSDGIIEWEDFLAKATGSAPVCYPDPGDLATIRYTSGTTGEAKGVTFDFAQLGWMGNVMTALLPWKQRNSSMSYLSFLPMSHVVEGILASYAPYYMLAKADYYFLNDFGMLRQMLPRVRPTVFFSVPRFYEKLWDGVISTKFGRTWHDMGGGMLRSILGKMLRRVTLRKAGLDRCGQLIVGSAPVSEKLLKNFREMGIEIYNAYGQTEAPLITINRLDDNVIPTVGTALPDTEVTLSEDGELLVRGPQVTRGYYGMESDDIRDGLLRTGDLATMDQEGHVTLKGRKKEMIVTAYGKNISIPKIEERLKDIDGIGEAVLIGENRPYCTALLWLDPDHEGGDGYTYTSLLDTEIGSVNRGLSHPEQIRDYRVIDEALSVERGELTPNLKIRRDVVERRYQREIEEMYQNVF